MLESSATSGQVLSFCDGFERNVVVIDDVIEGIINLILDWSFVDTSIINFAGPDLISRATMTALYKTFVNSNLEFVVENAPEGFWEARPKTIHMNSEYFSTVLQRKPISVEDKLKNWRK